MDIRSSLDGLKSLLSTSSADQVTSTAKSTVASQTAGASALATDSATFSSMGSQVSQAAGDEGVRMDKVTSIQSALAAGTYNVPASAVASKLVDSMMATA